jgi:hypothetical protein
MWKSLRTHMITRLIRAAVRTATICSLCVITGSSFAMPMRDLAGALTRAPSDFQTSAYGCNRYRCWSWPSYFDIPDHLRPTIFYGYQPHWHGDWFEHLYGRGWLRYGKPRGRW